MTSIFGTSGFFDSNKVQNQQAVAGYTNFTGTLANNGAPIYATGGPFLPLTGGVMSGAINMGTKEITNCGAYRFPANISILGNSSTTSGSINTTALGATCTIDGSSSGGLAVGYNSSLVTSSSGVVIGNACNASASNNCILIGQTMGATSGVNGIAIGNSSSTNATQAHSFGTSISNSTANSILVDASVNIRSNATTCDLGTTAKPFQKLLLNSYALTSDVNHSIPCVRCTYSNTSTGFSASTAETSIIDGTLSGSLTIPATTAAGFTMRLFQSWAFSTGVLTTFTVRLKVGGTTVFTFLVPAGLVTNQYNWFDIFIQLRSPSNRLYVIGKLSRNSGTTLIQAGLIDSIWNPAGSNAITMTGQFSDTNGTFRSDGFSLESTYAS